MNFIAIWWRTGLLQDCDGKGGVNGEDWVFILWENVLGSVTRKTETGGGVRSNQVKRLDYIRCFNVR